MMKPPLKSDDGIEKIKLETRKDWTMKKTKKDKAGNCVKVRLEDARREIVTCDFVDLAESSDESGWDPRYYVVSSE